MTQEYGSIQKATEAWQAIFMRLRIFAEVTVPHWIDGLRRNAIADEPVTFTIQSDPRSGAGGAFAGLAVATSRTNAKGIALAPPPKVNAKRGAFMVSATAIDVAESASFEVTID